MLRQGKGLGDGYRRIELNKHYFCSSFLQPCHRGGWAVDRAAAWAGQQTGSPTAEVFNSQPGSCLWFWQPLLLNRTSCYQQESEFIYFKFINTNVTGSGTRQGGYHMMRPEPRPWQKTSALIWDNKTHCLGRQGIINCVLILHSVSEMWLLKISAASRLMRDSLDGSP